MFAYQVLAESNKHNHTFSFVLWKVTCAIAPNHKQLNTVWFFGARPPFSSGLFRQPAAFHEQFEIRICPSPFPRMAFPTNTEFSVIIPCCTGQKLTCHSSSMRPSSGEIQQSSLPPPFTGKFKLKPNPFGTDSEWDFLKQWEERETYLKAHLLK